MTTWYFPRTSLAISAFLVLGAVVAPAQLIKGAQNAPVQPRTNTTLLSNDVSHMTRQQFRALPANAQVRYKGQSMTKTEFIQLRTRESLQGSPQPMTRATQQRPLLSAEQVRAQFVQQQAAALSAQNAKAQAAFDALERQRQQLEQSAPYQALLREAADLQQRFRSAPPAEQARLKQRAGEIVEQFRRLDQSLAAKR